MLAILEREPLETFDTAYLEGKFIPSYEQAKADAETLYEREAKKRDPDFTKLRRYRNEIYESNHWITHAKFIIENRGK